MTSKALLKKIVSLADDKKAENIVAMDVSNITSLSEYFVVCSASNLIQVKAIADNSRQNTQLKRSAISALFHQSICFTIGIKPYCRCWFASYGDKRLTE